MHLNTRILSMMYHRTYIIVTALLFLCNLNYYACNGLLSTKSIRRVGHHTTNTLPLIQLNLFDNTNNNNIFENLFSSSQQSKQQQWPKVEAPPNFITPEPRPLTVTESTDINGLVTASIALALRLATGGIRIGVATWYNFGTTFFSLLRHPRLSFSQPCSIIVPRKTSSVMSSYEPLRTKPWKRLLQSRGP